jgi:hypothetical protein
MICDLVASEISNHALRLFWLRGILVFEDDMDGGVYAIVHEILDPTVGRCYQTSGDERDEEDFAKTKNSLYTLAHHQHGLLPIKSIYSNQYCKGTEDKQKVLLIKRKKS